MTGPDFREELKAAGLRQIDLARLMGVAPVTVNRWATGKVPVPAYAVAYVTLRSFAKSSGILEDENT